MSTAKGRFVVDLTGIVYWRARVSTYVSGNVTVRVEEGGAPVQRITDQIDIGLVGQGSTQATAYPMTAVFNVFQTVAASTGAIIPGGIPRNSEIVVINKGANALLVYPPVGGKINAQAVNASLSVGVNGSVRFLSDGAGAYWSY